MAFRLAMGFRLSIATAVFHPEKEAAFFGVLSQMSGWGLESKRVKTVFGVCQHVFW
jgi:hypothetical protein